MFQPQATPFSAFASYGTGTGAGAGTGTGGSSSSVGRFSSYQPLGGGIVGVGVDGNIIHDSGGPTLFRETLFDNHLGGHLAFQNTTNQNTHNQHYTKMSSHDLAAQELAAQEYERERTFEGPLVGEKKSSHAIAEEYAKADPIYVAKTSVLPQTYSHYRPILGDGNCGWRAIAFSYFESLLRSYSKTQLEEERGRIMSVNNLLATAGGYDTWLIEDMTDQTTELLGELAELVEVSPDLAASTLLDRFQDPSVSASIVYHMRLLASTCLANTPSIYQDFIPDGSVDQYRKNSLETVNTEIEHLGMTLLIDILLKPIGIAVEIVYLDRSEGSQANSHIFQSEDSNGLPTNPGGPIIHLLYRPSHYDILYRDGPPPPDQQVIEDVSRSSNIQVNRATSLDHHHRRHIQNTTTTMNDFSQVDYNTLLNIPGFVMPPQAPHMSYQPQYHSPVDQGYARSPMSASISPISPGASVATTSSTATLPQAYQSQQVITQQQSHSSPSAMNSPHGLQTFPGPTTQIPIHSHLPQSNNNTNRPSPSSRTSLASELSSPTATPSSFRPSKYEYTAAEWHEPVAFQTSTFRNSHYNTAHYNNPNFQPEEWTPESEEVPTSRKKSG